MYNAMKMMAAVRKTEKRVNRYENRFDRKVAERLDKLARYDEYLFGKNEKADKQN